MTGHAHGRRRALVVGIGAGGLDQVTVEAVRALNAADVFLVTDKDGSGGAAGAGDLVRLREAVIARHRTDPERRIVRVADPPRNRAPRDDAEYAAAVRDWHAARARAWADALTEALPDGGTAVVPVWGDPALYDSAVRVLEQARGLGADLEYEVIPGVSSLTLLAARHRLVLNRIGGAVLVTTGRRLAADAAGGTDDLAVMLDGGLACADLPGEWEIHWGANLGTDDEELVAGPLAEVLPAIRAARTRAKAARGWVMDVYLLRRI
ncbi:precorrin-6A synthase (deacetylating) [Tomitella cavernea]|uniref:Precorrin-6A synthase (Deacetylating) n=1 Tax=Tomitella cavernea TaxID=1387982 RepID=A0ABP9CWQ1_9ACTN|nr:precorrin-6A synthase (deacetylating) [Tomitella cavernea]